VKYDVIIYIHQKILKIPISRHQHEIGYEGRYEYLLTYSTANFYVFTSTLVPEILMLKVKYFANCQDPNSEI
jgi:hypothetical protein